MNTTNLGKELFKLFHELPEISGKEYKTKQLIISIVKNLSNMDIVYSGKDGIIVSSISSNDYHHSHFFDIGFRSELDAVLLPENKINHSCGHDAHIVSLLVLMIFINKNREKYRKKFLFIFQSSEEYGDGAKRLAKDIDNLNIRVNYLYSVHNAPELRPNQVAARYGKSLSNNVTAKYSIYFSNYGHFDLLKSSSSGLMWVTNYICNLKKSISNNVKYDIGVFKSNGTISSSAEKMVFTLSLRSFNESLDYLLKKVDEISKEINKNAGVFKCTYKLINSHKQINNSKNLYKKIKNNPYLNFVEAPNTFSSDDFSAFNTISNEQMYFFIGSFKSLDSLRLHTTSFKINLDFIKATVQMYSYLVKEEK